MGGERSLLVLCGAWHGVSAGTAAERWPTLTLKKIPKVVLSRCEWGRDDYSLDVQNLPMAKPEPEAAPASERKSRSEATSGQGALFEEDSV